ncbi:MAG: tetratricopeptide repeat protein [Candidatus Fermentibacter sp.]|nr:tetratricopeptide repeat protein [Candidatus Fermentibacter sp.]
MNEGEGTTPSELSVSSLITGIGKLVFEISGQTTAIAGKVDSLEKLVSSGLFERLDRLIQGVETLQTISGQSAARPAEPAAYVPPSGVVAGEAQPPAAFPIESLTAPLEAGIARLASLESRVESIQSTVSETAGSIMGIAGPIGAAVSDSAGKLLEKAGSEGQEIRRLLSEQDERIGTLLEAVLQIGQSTREVSGVAAGLPGRLDALDGFVNGMPELLGRKMSEAASSGIAPVESGLAEMGAGIAAIPAAVKALEDGLAAKVADLDARTTGAISGLGGTLEAQKSILDDMRITLGEAAQGQEKTLAEMAGLLRTQKEAVNRTRVDDLNNEAIHSFNQGRLPEAAAALASALEIDPERPELLANLGHVQAAAGDMKASEETFKKALMKDPYLEPALSGLGLLYVKTGRPRDTLEILARFIEDPAPSSRIALACSRAMVSMERHADAIALLQRALAADPGNPDLQAELASYKTGN